MKALWNFVKRFITLILFGFYIGYVILVMVYFKNPHFTEGMSIVTLVAFHATGFLIIATAHAKAGYDIYHWYTRKKPQNSH